MHRWMPVKLRIKLALRILFAGMTSCDWHPNKTYWQYGENRDVVVAVKNRHV